MQRRDFIIALGGAAAAWPLAARAQQPDRMRRIGVLMNLRADDPEGQVRLKTFLQGLQTLGWIEGSNLRVDTCWGQGKAERFRSCAAELVGLAPDVILAGSGAAMPALMEATHSLPIVFVQTVDPVGSGYVASLAKPDGNATGFTQFEFSIGGKWLELLKQIAPQLTRVVVLRDVNVGDRTIRCNSVGCATLWCAVEANQCALSWRDRTWSQSFRSQAGRRTYRYGQCKCRSSSRPDHRAGDPTQVTCDLPFPLLCHQWRYDLLRA